MLNRFSLLHVRGGVSNGQDTVKSPLGSSPRPWRCFYLVIDRVDGGAVFSTSVEVFLKNPRNSEEKRGLLHVRGGVSKPHI